MNYFSVYQPSCRPLLMKITMNEYVLSLPLPYPWRKPIPFHAHSFRHFEAVAQSQSAAHCNAACKNIPLGGGARQEGGEGGREEGRRRQGGDPRSNLPSFPLTPPPPAHAQKVMDQRRLSCQCVMFRLVILGDALGSLLNVLV